MRRDRKARSSALAGSATWRASRYGSSASRIGGGGAGTSPVSARAAADERLTAIATTVRMATREVVELTIRALRTACCREQNIVIGFSRIREGRLLRGWPNRQRPVHSDGIVRIACERIRSVDEAGIDHEIVRLAGADDVRSGGRIAKLRALWRLQE